MSWSQKYKRSIDCDNPKGFSQKAHCQGKKKKLSEQKLKPYKTVEQIAKKHRLEVSFIQKQLDMGEPIEHEHTKDHKLAMEIALQHLDEIPDYYTRLKKMEADAKKHHKKFKDVKEETKSGDEGLRDWFGKSKSSDGKSGWVQLGGKWAGKPCARQPGQTSTPKCGSSKMKRALSKDEEEAARRRKNRLDPNQPEKSGGAKPTNVRTEEMDLQEVKDKPGKGSGKKDACYNKVKSRYSVWPSAYASGALVKCRKVGAANWGNKSESVEMVRYCPACKKNEMQSECKYGPKFWEAYSQPAQGLTDNQMKFSIAQVHPANEEKDHEYSMARSEISTIVAAAKRLKKKMGKGEGNLEAWVQSKITKAADYLDTAADYVSSGEHNESLDIQTADGRTFAQFIDIIGPNQMQAVVNEKCWVGYKQVGMKKKGEKIVPNCVKEQVRLSAATDIAAAKQLQKMIPPGEKVHIRGGSSSGLKPANIKMERFSNWREELSEDWQSVNKSDKTDGMSPAAVKAYRRENPGSKLKTAVTGDPKPGSKDAKRRKSFCSRSKGQQDMHNIDCSKDPDKAICKARRRWKC